MTPESLAHNGTPGNVRDAAREFLAHGVYTIPLAPRTKKCLKTGWESWRIREDEIDKKFARNANIGILLGEPSSGIVDIDLDSTEAILAAPILLPVTDMISGRRSAPTSHWWYRLDAPPAKSSDSFFDPVVGGKLLEFRSTGGQTVVPPSIYPADPEKGHPHAEPCVWHRHSEPAHIDTDVLRGAVRGLAAASLLGRHWPKGSRHDASLALAGGLLRAGWSEERVETFIGAVCAAAGDDEVRDRVRAVRDSAERLRDGRQATGWPAMARILGTHGEAVVGRVREWLGIRSDPRPTLGSGPTPRAVESRRWPDPPHDAAYSGLAGEFVRAIEPTSEADPVAVLAQTLVCFGNVIGRSAHFVVEADKHYANEFAVMMGRSSKARKGTSHGRVRAVFTEAERLTSDAGDADVAGLSSILGDTSWAGARNQSGLSSGEGLIWAVRDPIEKKERVKEKGQPVRYETVVADDGEPDKRLMVYEPEFANVLKQAERQGNTLSTTLRQAWESGNIRSMVKNSPAKATGAHISLIGHVTTEELARYLTVTESANGFGNRHLWFAVQRSKELPEGGRPDPEIISGIQGRLAEAIKFARGVGEVRRDDEARELWGSVYSKLSSDRPGLSGCLLGRAEAHTMRLALIYALLDRSSVIRAEHLLAALALWDYAERSVLYVFGNSLGDPMADDLLRLLQQAPAGMTRTDISTYLGRHAPSSQIGRALGLLLQHGRARVEHSESGGRPIERWFIATGPG